jgi:hypothetical protein
LIAPLSAWLAWIGAALRVPFLWESNTEVVAGFSDTPVDPDFDGWVHNDPMITGNPASRYGDDAPGYLTGNGLGSLEIGAADD